MAAASKPDAMGGGTFKPPPPPKPGPATGQAFKANKSFFNKGFEPSKVPVPKLSSLAEQALALDTEKSATIGAAVRGVMTAGRAAMPAIRSGLGAMGTALRAGGSGLGTAAKSVGTAMKPIGQKAMGVAKAEAMRIPGARHAGKVMTGVGAAGTVGAVGNNMANNNAQGRNVFAEDLSKVAEEIMSIPNLDTNEALVTRLKLAQAGVMGINPRDIGAILFHSIR